MKNTIHKKRDPFTMISNTLVSDKLITLKSKGLYLFMKSKPDKWNFTIKSMSKQLKEGERSIMNGLQELKEFGYVDYKKNNDGTGEYFLNENPNCQNSNESQNDIMPDRHNSSLTKQQRISNNDLYSNNDLISNNIFLMGNDKFLDAFKDFKKMRKAIKKPLIESAEKRSISRAEKLAKDNPDQVKLIGTVEDYIIHLYYQSVDKGWADVYPLKDEYLTINNFTNGTERKQSEESRKNSKPINQAARGYESASASSPDEYRKGV